MWSKLVRWTIVLVGSLFGLLVLLVAVLHLPAVRSRMLEWAQARVSRDFGIAVTADALDYNLLAFSAELRNVSVSASGDTPFVRADRIRVVLDRAAIFGTLEPTSLVLEKPRLTFVRHRDGTTNVPTGHSTSSASPGPIHLGIVTVMALTADARDEGTGHTAIAGPLDVTLDTRGPSVVLAPVLPAPLNIVINRGDGARTISGRFGGNVGFDGEHLQIAGMQIDTSEGLITLNGSMDIGAENTPIDVRGRFDTNLKNLAPFIGDSEAALEGRANVDVNARGPLANPSIDVVARLNDVRYQSLTHAAINVEGTYADGHVQIRQADLTSELGNAVVRGDVLLLKGENQATHVTGEITALDVDRLLTFAAVSNPIPIGAQGAGTIDITIDSQTALSMESWRDTAGKANVTLTPTATGLGVGGRLTLSFVRGRWTLQHTLYSNAAQSRLEGTLSGDVRTSSGGLTDSTLSGRSRLQVESVHALLPFAQRAGVDLPASISAIDGTLDAVMNPRGSMLEPKVVAIVNARDIRVPDYPDVQLEATVDVDRRDAKIATLSAVAGTVATMKASGSYSWSGQLNTRFSVGVDDVATIAKLAGEGTALPVTGSATLTGTLQGAISSLRGEADLAARDMSAYEVTIGRVDSHLRLADNHLAIQGTAPAIHATLQASVGIQDPFSYQAEATLDESSIAGLLPVSVRQQINIDGTVTTTVNAAGVLTRPLESAGEVSLRSVNARIDGVPVVVNQPAQIAIRPDAVTAKALMVNVGDHTAVRVDGELASNDTRRGMEIHVEGPLSDLLTIASPVLSDVHITAEGSNATLDLHVGGTLLTPRPSGVLTVNATSLRYADQPPLTDVAVAAQIEPAQITATSIAGKWLGATLDGRASVPFRLVANQFSPGPGASGFAAWGSRWLGALPPEPAAATLSARITGITTDVAAPFVDASSLRMMSALADATITATADAFALDHIRGSVVLDRASADVADVRFSQAAPTRIRFADGRATIDEFRWNAESNELRVSGGMDLLSADRSVDLAVNGDLDLRVLGAFVTGIESGGIAHSAITVKGPLASPQILGNFAVSGGELRLDTPGIAASDIDGAIAISTDRIATIDLKGSINGGTVAADGYVSLEDLRALSGRLLITARNVTLDYPEGLQSESNADLVLDLATRESTLSGSVDILSSVYQEPIVVSRSLLSALRGQSGITREDESSFLSTLALDLTVATAEALRVDNNYGRVNFSGTVQVTGTALRPGAVGRIDAEPDGQVYLAGNTYQIESLAIDLTNPKMIAPDLSLTASTRVSGTPIELLLQCSASGACEHEIRSSSADEEHRNAAEAQLFGTTGRAEASAQLARLLTGELLGLVGQTVGVNTLRLEQEATGHTDIFDDPSLVAGDINAAARLTIGKRVGDHVELAYSQNLTDARFTTSTTYFGPAGISARAVLFDDQSGQYEFRHEPRFGAAPQVRRTAIDRHLVVGTIRFSGTPGFSERDLRGQLRLTDGNSFAFTQWQADRERLKVFYQQHNFFEARVRARRLLPSGEPFESSADPLSTDSLILEYVIDRGPQTRLEITGFDIPEFIRDRIVRRWSSVVFDGFLERDATLILGEYLYGKNRLQARVVAKVERAPAEDRKTLRVTIEPGPELSPELRFEGNRALSTTTLVESTKRVGPLAPWLDPASFGALITRLYREEGYLSAAVDVQAAVVDDNASVVHVVIREGEPWQIGGVTVDGVNRDHIEVADRLGLPATARYTPKAVADAASAFEQQLRDRGFLSAHVSTEISLNTASRLADVHVFAETGRRTILNSISVDGSSQQQEAVTRRLTLETGPLSASVLAETKQRLYETGVYRSVEIDLQPLAGAADAAGAAGTDQNVVARIRVEERPRYSFRYGLAVRDDIVGDGEHNQSAGFAADLANDNVLGSGATVGLSARLRRDQEVGRLFVTTPTLFGLPLRSNLFLSRKREDIGSDVFKSVANITQIDAEQVYRVRNRLSVRYGYEFGYNTTSFGDSALSVTVNIARLRAGLLIDRRDDPFDPTRGWFSSESYELSSPGLGSQLSFTKSFFQQYQFVPLPHHVVIASAARVGLARTFRDEDLIPSERYKGGGATTIRGYHDNAVGPQSVLGFADGGSAMLIINNEARFPIYRWLRGVGFLDFGNVYPAVSDMFHTRLQFGAGGGLRLATPVGLLRLDLGTPLNPTALDPKWTVHFGLGHAF